MASGAASFSISAIRIRVGYPFAEHEVGSYQSRVASITELSQTRRLLVP